MELKLYNCFNHWFHGGQVYIYSDPHFADKDSQFFRTNYIGDDEQVKRINSKMGKKDTLLLLGDVGDKEFLKKIRGYKVLILGNHDAGATNYKDYVDEIYEGILAINEKIVLSHEPIDFPFAYNIHGHVHAKSARNDKNHFNACAEHIDYTPVSLKELVKSGVLKNIPSIHRVTIDEATARKKKKNK